MCKLVNEIVIGLVICSCHVLLVLLLLHSNAHCEKLSCCIQNTPKLFGNVQETTEGTLISRLLLVGEKGCMKTVNLQLILSR